MASMNENERAEYSILMSRGRDAERTSHFCWIASGIAATMLLSWGMAAHSPALMLPVIFCVAYGFYTMAHGRQQTAQSCTNTCCPDWTRCSIQLRPGARSST